MGKRSFALALLVLSAPACGRRASPPPQLPALPATWAAEASPLPADLGWITTFDDEALSALVREALSANYDLAASAARLEAAWAEARIAGADRLPQAQAQASSSRGQTIPTLGPVDAFQLTLSASWELDLWGRWRQRGTAAGAHALAVAADRDAAALSIAGQVAKAWYAARSAGAEAQVAQALVAIQRQALDLADRRLRAGLLDAEAVREWRTALAAAENRAASAAITRATRIRQLEVLLGRYPSGQLTCPSTLPPLPGPPAAGIPAAVLVRRPDVRAAEQRYRAALARGEAAQADLYPRFALTASAGRSSADLGDLLDADFRVWSLGANLLQPVFQGGRLRANRDRADAEAQASGALFAHTVLRALGEVEIALITGTLLSDRDQRQTEIVAEANALETRAEARLSDGLGTALGQVAAQRGALEAELNALAVRLLRFDNRIDLHLALGGHPLIENVLP